MREKVVQTAFRLHERELTQLDALVESPPEWLRSCAPGAVTDRTDALRRLIFLAAKQSDYGKTPVDGSHTETGKPTTTGRPRKAKQQRKR